VAERILAGAADMVSMARPFLADPEFVIKAAEDRADEINTCIACNQACLDHVFKQSVPPAWSTPRLLRDRADVWPGAPAQEAGGGGRGPAGWRLPATAAEAIR
jgi:2,4-dienoyl-CoA reductase (NADPH2)